MERDDLILDHSYSLAANHDEEHGKQMRKMIWKVTAILSIVTIIEVGLGIAIKHGDALWPLVKFTFLALTLLKAGYIVMEFMHLGQERKNFRWMLLGPYFVFLSYLVFQLITEASYQGEMLHGTIETAKVVIEQVAH